MMLLIQICFGIMTAAMAVILLAVATLVVRGVWQIIANWENNL